MRPANLLLTSCLMFTVIAGAPALAAYAIAFNPSSECRRNDGVNCNTAAAICD